MSVKGRGIEKYNLLLSEILKGHVHDFGKDYFFPILMFTKLYSGIFNK